MPNPSPLLIASKDITARDADVIEPTGAVVSEYLTTQDPVWTKRKSILTWVIDTLLQVIWDLVTGNSVDRELCSNNTIFLLAVQAVLHILVIYVCWTRESQSTLAIKNNFWTYRIRILDLQSIYTSGEPAPNNIVIMIKLQFFPLALRFFRPSSLFHACLLYIHVCVSTGYALHILSTSSTR